GLHPGGVGGLAFLRLLALRVGLCFLLVIEGLLRRLLGVDGGQIAGLVFQRVVIRLDGVGILLGLHRVVALLHPRLVGRFALLRLLALRVGLWLLAIVERLLRLLLAGDGTGVAGLVLQRRVIRLDRLGVLLPLERIIARLHPFLVR